MPAPNVVSVPNTPARDTYFIVVAGAMNPAIHHAHWYRVIGAIDEAELQSSLQVPTNTNTAIASQVQFGSLPLIVNCQPNQWMIRSNSAILWPRMLTIAALVFTKLNETPVNGYGLAIQRHIDTNTPEVKSILAKSLVDSQLGFPNVRSTASNLTMTIVEDDYNVTLSVQASLLSERAVFVACHAQYPVPQEPGKYFDIGSLIAGRYEKFASDSAGFVAGVVGAVNARDNKEAK